MAVHAVQSQQNGGDLPYKSTQINKYYADYVHKTKATIPLEHKPGETIQLDRQEAELLFRLISERYEHGSIILTGNQYFSYWGNCSAPISWPPLGGLSFEQFNFSKEDDWDG